MNGSRRLIETGREVFEALREAEVTFLAAAIAYYGFVSVLPAILFAIAIASIVGGEALVGAVLAATDEFLTESGRSALEASLTGARGRAGATVFGIALLAWSTLRVFKGLDVAFSRVYGTTAAESLVAKTIDAAVVLFTVGLGLSAMIVGGAALAALYPTGGDVLGLLALLVGLSVVFLPLYYFLPDSGVTVREALPGTVLSALGWVALQAGFQAYATGAAQFSVYGVIGGVLLLVTWFYFAALLLLVGAVLNRVLAS